MSRRVAHVPWVAACGVVLLVGIPIVVRRATGAILVKAVGPPEGDWVILMRTVSCYGEVWSGASLRCCLVLKRVSSKNTSPNLFSS
jgi:hypothetical protein